LGLFDAKVAKANRHGRGTDSEHPGQISHSVGAAEVGGVHPGPWHEQAGGEVIADPLDHGVTFGLRKLGVDDIDEAVIEDMLELMGQAEALAGERFSTVEGDHPPALSPVGCSRERKRCEPIDVHSGQRGDRRFRNGWVVDALEGEEPFSLKLGVAKGFGVVERTEGHAVSN